MSSASSSSPSTTQLVETERRKTSRSWFSQPRLTVLLYVAAYITTGAIGAFVSFTAQAILDAALALLAVNHAIFGYRVKRTAGLVMAALFTTRLMVVALPATAVSVPTRTAVIAGASILVAYLATWVLSHDVSAGRIQEGFPLKRPIISRNFTSVLVAATGLPIGGLAYLFLQPDPLVTQPLFQSTALPVMLAGVALCLGAMGEELIFRRLVAAMVQHSAQSQSPFISAALFAGAYLGTLNVGFIILTFLAGALYAWSCERTGSIKPAVISHSIASILVFVVLPT